MPTDPLDELPAVARRLADLEADVSGWSGHLAALAATNVLAQNARTDIQALQAEVAELRAHIGAPEGDPGPAAGSEPPAQPADEPPYQPAPQLRWHELDDTGRAAVLDRIREWVETVYRPQFADGGRDLLPCWDMHLPCIVVLDALSQMHTGLYHGHKRNLARVGMQLEHLTRNAREAAAVLRLELAGCKTGHQERRVMPATGVRR